LLLDDAFEALDLAHEPLKEDMRHLDRTEELLAGNTALVSEAVADVATCNALEEGCS
jgi:hypothetical protein